MDPETPVLFQVEDGLATVVMNRPARRNAITGPLADALADVFTQFSRRNDVEVVLFHGADGGFCSGLDLTEYNSDPPPAWLPTATASLIAAHQAIASCPVPVVGALERFAVNGGAAFALACDLLVVGKGAFLQVGEVRQGMPAAMNLAWLLNRHSLSVTQQLVLTGRRFSGIDLYRLGIALDVVTDDRVLEAAMTLARELAGFPPGASRNMKEHTLLLSAANASQSEGIRHGADLLARSGPQTPQQAQ